MNQRSGDEWKAARHDVITGTDVGKILGCDSQCSRTKLLGCKIAGIDPAEDASDYAKHLMELGKAFEPVALGAFKEVREAHGLDYEGVVPGMKAHSLVPWFVGTPDFILDDGGAVVEIKTHFYPSAARARPFECVQRIPSRHWLQVQAYMEILDVDTGFLWSWTMENGGSCFEIRRAKMFWIQTVMPELSEFWAKMVEGKKARKTWAQTVSPEFPEFWVGMAGEAKKTETPPPSPPRYKWTRGAKGSMIGKVEAEKMNTTTVALF